LCHNNAPSSLCDYILNSLTCPKQIYLWFQLAIAKLATLISRELYKLYKILDGKNSTQLIIHSLNPIGRKFDRLYNGKDSTQLITHSPLI
jgi:hypothetical protein